MIANPEVADVFRKRAKVRQNLLSDEKLQLEFLSGTQYGTSTSASLIFLVGLSCHFFSFSNI